MASSSAALEASEPKQPADPSPSVSRRTLTAAKAITRNEDLNSIIFRRFDTLAIQNILDLHKELTDIDREVQNTTPMAVKRVKIRQYHEAVLLYSKMLKLSEPPSGYVRDLNRALEEQEVDDVWAVLDPESNLRAKTSKDLRPFADLVAVSPFDDPFTRFVATGPLSVFFVGWIESVRQRALLVNMTALRWVVAVIQFAVSLGFVVTAMWALWILGNDIYRKLWVVTGFVAGFSIWVGFLTGLTKKESIVAMAAYAAVLVVYVGGPGAAVTGTA